VKSDARTQEKKGKTSYEPLKGSQTHFGSLEDDQKILTVKQASDQTGRLEFVNGIGFVAQIF